MADALEDDYVLSGDEQSLADAQSDGEGLDRIDAKQEPTSTKRKQALQALNPANGDSDDEDAKRARKKQKQKAKKAKRAAANLAMEPGTLARFPPDMQADHLRKLLRSCPGFTKMTDMELDEVSIAESMLVDTSSAREERTKETLAAFIRKVAPRAVETASNAVKSNHPTGEPCIVVVSGNAQRAADLSRALRSLSPSPSSSKAAEGTLPKATKESAKAANGKKESDAEPKVAVAKLFARHFKVAEQLQFLQTHICPLAVGTPQRLSDLLQDHGEHKAGLSFSRVEYIVLDATWTDQKQRTMLDGAETRQGLFTLLSSKAVQARLRAGKGAQAAKIILF